MTGTFLVDRAGRIARLFEQARGRARATLAVLVLVAVVIATVAEARELQRGIVFLSAASAAVYYLGRGWLRDPLEAHKGVADMVVGVAFGCVALFPTRACAVVDAAVLSVEAGLFWIFVEALEKLMTWLLDLPPRPA